MTLPTRLVSASLFLLVGCSMPMTQPDAGRPGRFDGGVTDRFPVLPAVKAKKVVVGDGFACALTVAGTVRCWGAAGQPKNPVHAYSYVGSSVDYPRVALPIEVPSLSGVEDIDTTYRHVCVVVSGGSVQCWGGNDWSKIGVELPEDGGTRYGDALTPIPVGGVSGVTKIATGDRHTCAVLSSGGVRCWGADFAGQLLGQSTEFMRSHRPLDMPGISGVTDIAAYGTQTCAIAAGTIKCWGMGPVNGATEATAPFTVPLTGVTSLGLNRSASCAAVGGAAKCWGIPDFALLGDGTDTGDLESRMPVQVFGLTSGVTNVTRQCAVANGVVKCWGRDGRLLGDGTTKPSARPVDVLTISDAVQVSSNTEVTCAVTSSGQVWCWGDNQHGAVGNGFDIAEVGVRNYAAPQRVLSFE
ncbi:MAG: hypothetical protein QM817_39455 [Archangium sp.]